MVFYKKRIFCITEDKFIDFDSLLNTCQCPNDPEHEVDSQSFRELTEECSIDYKKLRKNVILKVIETQGNLPYDELLAAAKNFALPVEIRDLLLTKEEQITNGILFHKQSCASRRARRDACISELMNRLTYIQTYEIITDLSPGNFLENYVNLGVEGTSEGDPVGLYDYFQSSEGTIFENNGFLQKSFIPSGMTIEELSEKILDILKNGNY